MSRRGDVTVSQASVAAPHDEARRQLALLRTYFPAWLIERFIKPDGDRWRATRRRAVHGFDLTIERDSAPALASALSHQAQLIHNVRSFRTPEQLGAADTQIDRGGRVAQSRDGIRRGHPSLVRRPDPQVPSDQAPSVTGSGGPPPSEERDAP